MSGDISLGIEEIGVIQYVYSKDGPTRLWRGVCKRKMKGRRQ